MKYFFRVLITFVIVLLFAGCASMQVKGRHPVERAISATFLLLDGKTSDSYIKVYKKELALAEAEITGMIQAARSNQINYTNIADNISSWLTLYNNIKILHDLYPNGLQEKKEFVTFKTRDYTKLAEEAPIKATEALYAKAQNINTSSGNNFENRLTALSILSKSKTYSNHLYTEINALGAEICYSVAENLSTSRNPEDIMQAIDLYTQSYNWIPNYKNAMQKVPALEEKATSLYMARGDSYMTSKDYSSFRNAKDAYKKAENIITGIATFQLAKVNTLLTIKLLVLFGGPNSNYPNKADVIDELQAEMHYNSYGPENLEVQFRHITGSYDIFFANTANADLVLIPAERFGDISENLDPVDINRKNVYKTIDAVMYEGTIIEYVQTVTVFFDNTVILYDLRKNWNTSRSVYDAFEGNGKKIFAIQGQKTTKTFISRTYEGDAEATPEFDPGVQYIPGQYADFFPAFHQNASAYIPITEEYGTLNSLGKEICSLIEDLEY